jgi:hypothetical protein
MLTNIARKHIALTAVGLAAVITAAIATASFARTSGATPPGLDRISAQGVPASLTAPERADAGRWNIGALRQLDRVNGAALYMGTATDGSNQPCYAFSIDTGNGLAAGGCLNGGGFPSATDPVLDMSIYGFVSGWDGPRLTRIEGFAADGVSSVTFTDTSGNSVSVPVHNNVYASRHVPPGTIKQIAAVDAKGAVLTSHDIATE